MAITTGRPMVTPVLGDKRWPQRPAMLVLIAVLFAGAKLANVRKQPLAVGQVRVENSIIHKSDRCEALKASNYVSQVQDLSEKHRQQVIARLAATLAKENFDEFKIHVAVRGEPLFSQGEPPTFLGIRVAHVQVSVVIRGKAPSEVIQSKVLKKLAKCARLEEKRGDQFALTYWESVGQAP